MAIKIYVQPILISLQFCLWDDLPNNLPNAIWTTIFIILKWLYDIVHELKTYGECGKKKTKWNIII